jgi:hypothetical protein
MMIIERESTTIIKLTNPKTFQEFMIGYFAVLKKELQLREVMDNKGNIRHDHYTCGQPHDRRNPQWKPFRVLESYCKRLGYDDFEARDLIEEKIARKLTCECELLGN